MLTHVLVLDLLRSDAGFVLRTMNVEGLFFLSLGGRGSRNYSNKSGARHPLVWVGGWGVFRPKNYLGHECTKPDLGH